MADPNLEISGGERSPKKFFEPFEPQFGLKIRGPPGPPAPSPGSATARKPSGIVIIFIHI